MLSCRLLRSSDTREPTEHASPLDLALCYCQLLAAYPLSASQSPSWLQQNDFIEVTGRADTSMPSIDPQSPT